MSAKDLRCNADRRPNLRMQVSAVKVLAFIIYVLSAVQACEHLDALGRGARAGHGPSLMQ